ncbi:MAG: cytochrome c4 [Candidatus Parabeggiatoa sp. nov. 1]|nr:MAG: cytochrome c4 [Gammaproteobacteria bacterium]
MLVGTCFSCHGYNGSSLGPTTPTIAGLDNDTFVQIMTEYKDGERPSTIMGRIAKGYTGKDFQRMAEYFAKQPFVRYPQLVNTAKVKKGAILHEKYCERCHQDNGYTDYQASGILAGQWMPYLQLSLADFQINARNMPRKMKIQIRKMIKGNGEESINDIVHFYGSQTRTDVDDD